MTVRTGTTKTQRAAAEAFIPLIRELVRAYQVFAAYDAAGFRDTDLTVPQADVIFTLGNTDGLSFKEIGARTLITKGTLTGVINRLETKRLVKRKISADDGRSSVVSLTPAGRQVFEHEFPRQIAWLKRRLGKLSSTEIRTMVRTLEKLRKLF